MEIFIIWIIFSVLVGVYASAKKRSGVGWFFVSLILSPLIGFLIIFSIGLPGGQVKKCPKCAEQVKSEAKVCRFCSYEFPIQVPVIDPGQKLTSKKRWF